MSAFVIVGVKSVCCDSFTVLCRIQFNHEVVEFLGGESLAGLSGGLGGGGCVSIDTECSHCQPKHTREPQC